MNVDELLIKLQKIKDSGYEGSLDIIDNKYETIHRIYDINFLNDVYASGTQGYFLRSYNFNKPIIHNLPLIIQDGIKINKNSIVDIGEYITLRYNKRKNVKTKILGYEIIACRNSIYVQFEIDEDTLLGVNRGNCDLDFYDADLEHVIVDGIESEGWTWG